MGTHPTSTYRLQLHGPSPDATPGEHSARTFDDAVALAPYLDRLGIGHVYTSPVLEAFPGSQHLYDVVDPTRVSGALGGRDGLRRLRERLNDLGLGLVVDVVPNHVGVEQAAANPWFWDVLRLGRDSEHADVFDIDWAAGRIALPVLGAASDTELLEVVGTGDDAELRYYDHRFPVAPGTADGTAAQVHDRQAYELVSWRSGRVGYRRFFHVNGLAAVRVDDPAVFARTHAEIERWLAEDLVDGLRVDHPDGLAAPAAYLTRLRALLGPDRWLVVEKILAPDEPLDPTLPVQGTTGYDALREIGGVLVDPAGAEPLADLAARFDGARGEHADVAAGERALKAEVVREGLRPEALRCVAAVRTALGSTAPSAEVLLEALALLVAELPVYRADYTTTSPLAPASLVAAQRAHPASFEALDALATGLTASAEAATRFQQVAGATTAKGVEDRLFYRLPRLVSLTEVGGSPDRFGVSPGTYHWAAATRAQRWPATMTTLSTHDTKRGEDVRARISVLSELPRRWAETMDAVAAAAPLPDGPLGVFLVQNLIGVWPGDGSRPGDAVVDRFHAYAEKAVREAGTRTEWNSVDGGFEDALHGWLDALLRGPAGDPIAALVGELAVPGWTNALTQKLLHLTGPGVPDVYQGTELWEDTLVDPDNRREVDHDLRSRLLAELDGDAPPPPVDATGRAKLLLVSRTLRLRRERPGSFVGGDYRPAVASGPARDHLIGAWRGPTGAAPDVLALGTRLSVGLTARGGWADTALSLPSGAWTDRLTGSTHRGDLLVGDALRDLPVAVLVRQDTGVGATSSTA